MDDIVVALVRRAHGLGGELHVAERTDDPEEVFTEGRVFQVDGAPEGRTDRLTLTAFRPHRGGWLLRFGEIGDRTSAEAYAGCELTLPKEELRPLDENEFFVQELVGYDVIDVDGEMVGPVRAVYDASGQTFLGVDVNGRELLIPFSRQVVREVKAGEGKIRIDPPPGLLEL